MNTFVSFATSLFLTSALLAAPGGADPVAADAPGISRAFGPLPPRRCTPQARK